MKSNEFSQTDKNFQLSLTQEVALLMKARARETEAHERVHDFLTQKLDSLTDERTQWGTKYEADHASQQTLLTKMREDSSAVRTRLNVLRERESEAEVKKGEKDREAEMLLQVEKFRLAQESKTNEAVFYLQEEGRNYIVRMQVRASRSKGKKGKKGKKK